MQAGKVRSARKRAPISAPRSTRQTRQELLSQLREEVEILHVAGLDHEAIAECLKITTEDVRSFCPTQRKGTTHRILPRRALRVLLFGRRAQVGGKTLARRVQNLARIAAAFSEEELALEPAVGSVTINEIALWLEEHGLAFRAPKQGRAKPLEAVRPAPVVVPLVDTGPKLARGRAKRVTDRQGVTTSAAP